MPKPSYLRVRTSAVSTPIKITDLDGDGVAASPIEWVHLPGVVGSTVTIKDMTGTSSVLTSTDQVSAWSGHFKEITASSGAVTFGTGDAPPAQGAKGDQGDAGAPSPDIPIAFKLSITTAIPAGTDLPEMYLGTNLSGGDTFPFTNAFFWVGGAVVQSDTDWLIFTWIKRDAANSATTLSTTTTKVTGGVNLAGGTTPVNQATGTPTLEAGSSLYVKVTHGGAGKILPTGTLYAIPN